MTDILDLTKEMLELEKVKLNVERRKDSIEIGTPSKGGALKVYYDSSNPEEGKGLIDNAIEVRRYAQEKLMQGGPTDGGA
jgi:hypothetical protein